MTKFEEFIRSELPIKNELQKIFDNKVASVIFDIGACEGEDSIRYSYLFENSIIYSFEPLPSNFKKCLKNINRFANGRIKPFQLALSNINGIAKFFVSSGSPEGVSKSDWEYGNKSSSLYPPHPSFNKYPWLKFNDQIEVKTKTIESFCHEQNIEMIDFIHMDVQGAELDVLEGAGNQINKIRAIWLEVENVPMYEGQPLKKDIELFMMKHNFFKVIDTSAFSDSGDQLFLNSYFFSKFSSFSLKTRITSKLKIIYRYMQQFKKYLS